MSPFGRSDSPPPSWYEPPDEPEDDDVVSEPDEDVAIVAGVVCWHTGTPLNDDDL